MSKRILFIVEGVDVELTNVTNIFRKYLELIDEEDFSVSAHGTVIYSLYKDLKSDEYDSFPDYLRAKRIKGSDGKLLIEDGVRPNEAFSSIYLVFDLDPHASNYSDEKASFFASYFSDETKNGKILFNYPMFESIRDISKDDERDKTFYKLISLEGFNGDKYKKAVNESTTLTHEEDIGLKLAYLAPKNIPTSLFFNVKRYESLHKEDSSIDLIRDGINQEKTLKKEITIKNELNALAILNTFILLLLNYQKGIDMLEEEIKRRKTTNHPITSDI